MTREEPGPPAPRYRAGQAGWLKSGPALISGQLCFPVPVTSGAPAVIPQLSADTYGKVVLAG